MFKTELQNDNLKKIYEQNLKPNISKPKLLKSANNVTSNGNARPRTMSMDHLASFRKCQRFQL